MDSTRTAGDAPQGMARTAVEAFTSEGGRIARQGDEQTPAEFGVTFDGRDFRYDGYRYVLLKDALAYSQLQRERVLAAR